ncbi:hypothetical protein APZ41_021680, partial [Roseomonas mucosa]
WARTACRQLRLTSSFQPELANVTMPAMTMYLVHVPIVLWLTVGFLAVGWPAEVEFLLITIITVAASYGFHCLVARHPILVVLFNGQAASARAKGSAIVKAEPSGTRA